MFVAKSSIFVTKHNLRPNEADFREHYFKVIKIIYFYTENIREKR